MRIIIVGGVAAGMSAAARARRHSEEAEIIVLERGPEVSFANCGLPYHVSAEIDDARDLRLHTPDSLKAALNLDVRTRHDVIAIDTAAQTVTALTPDGAETSTTTLSCSLRARRRHDLPFPASIRRESGRSARWPTPSTCAPGSTRRSPRCGARRGLHRHRSRRGAAPPRARGRRRRTRAPCPPRIERELAQVAADELEHLGIRVHPGIAATSIGDDGVQATVTLSDGRELIADVVVLSVGVRPDTAFVADAGIATERGAIVVDERGRTSAPRVGRGRRDPLRRCDPGDPPPVALAGPANRAGRLIADDIFGAAGARAIPSALGTAIVRIGELTVASTGANRDDLVAAGVPFRTVHLHPNQHAGYFLVPRRCTSWSTSTTTERSRRAGRREGVDKRIDVLTAMRAGLRAPDLIDLDLAYAPPYGQAKDAVNLLGMVAENLLADRLRLWYAEEATTTRMSWCSMFAARTNSRPVTCRVR
jgi:NADPH-dependent 2,4-dienoyl-CoA reductase/sulfur reductase-like enzyme